jgi:hypothetical protein
MAGEGLIHGGNFRPARNGTESTTVRERRGESQQEALDRLAREREAEQEARQRRHDAQVREEAERLAAIRTQMRERIESAVGTLGLTLQLPGLAIGLVVRPTLDSDQRDRLAVTLRAVVEAALSWQRSAATAAAYPQIEPFSFEARSWAGELSRLVGALHDEGLVELVER